MNNEATAEFIQRVNKALSALNKVKVTSADQFHKAKMDILKPLLPNELYYQTWGISKEGEYKDIFSIHLEINRDKRIKYGMVGEIVKTEITPAEKYSKISIQMPLKKYLLNIDRINLKESIAEQYDEIAKKEKELSEIHSRISLMNKEFERLNKEIGD